MACTNRRLGCMRAGANVVPTRSSVSLTVLEYMRWPHGAMLRLTNGTQTTIRYRAEPTGEPPVFLIQALDGKVRGDNGIFAMPELKPGKAVDFLVYLEPDAPPTRVGILYEVPQTQQSRLALKSELWLVRAKGWLGLKMVPRGQKEAWSRPLSVGSSRQPHTGNKNATVSPPDELTGANAGGRRELTVPTDWAGRVAQFCRSASGSRRPASWICPHC